MNFDYQSLQADIEAATLATYEAAIADFAAGNISGLALYSDLDAMVLSATINTVENLEENRDDDPDDFDYYRWSPGEWAEEMFNVEAYNDINERLSEASEKVSNANYPKHKEGVYEAAVAALEKLKKNHPFKDAGAGFVLVFAVSDFSEPDLEKSWITRLNSPKLAEEFATWLDTAEE